MYVGGCSSCTYATAKVGPDLDNQAHVVVIRSLDSVDEDAGLSAHGVVHADDAGAKVPLHLGKVPVHLVVAVGRGIAVAVFQRVREAQEAVVVGLRAPPLVEGSAGSSKVAGESGVAHGEAVAGGGGSGSSRGRKSGHRGQGGEGEQRGDHGCGSSSLEGIQKRIEG